MAVAALMLAGAAGCVPVSESGDGGDDLALAWEAWDAIHANYAAADPDGVAGGAIGRIMDLGELEPYPFLADIGRMRGQIPSSVPAGLGMCGGRRRPTGRITPALNRTKWRGF